MKEQITKSQFIDKFKDIRPDNFTYDGLSSLYDYIEDLENDIGQEIELDVIALCCEYSEYKDVGEFLKDYQNTIVKTEREDFEDDEEEEYNDAVLEELRDHTTVINIGGESFIIQCF